MTVHITVLVAVARFFEPGTVYGQRYAASAVLQWEGPKVLNVSAFTVNSGHHVSRAMLREFVDELVKLGIERIRATREHGRVLPLGVKQSDGTFLHDVAELVEYCARDERRRPARPAPPAPGPQRRRGEKDWQPTVPDGLNPSHELENHSRPSDPPEIQRVKPEPPAEPDEKV
jgi:hypothetical protein